MPPTRTSPEDTKVRKMRKGTHSCFECRRRKIRCIFSPDNSEVCTECFARGAKCIDQEHASADAIVDQRKNLRERVSRLESIIETLLRDKEDTPSTRETLRNLRGDPFPQTPTSDVAPPESAATLVGAPLMQMFNNDVLSRAEKDGVTHTIEEMPVRSKAYSQHGTPREGPLLEFDCTRDDESAEPPVKTEEMSEKYEQSRRAILSQLPSYQQIVAAFSTSDKWWTAFRSRCVGTSTRYSSLSDFAMQALTKGWPPQLGLLALGIGIALDKENLDKYTALVDKEVVQDEEYCSSLEGLECIVLLAKCYADIGQPRKAWLAQRRGLMFAQLQGMHRNHSINLETESIWWCLFQGDRFVSMLLGLPYAVSDAHCDLTLKGEMADHTKSPYPFIVEVCKVAGKVIDQTQGPGESSLSYVHDLDARLEKMQDLTPEGWWDLSSGIVEPLAPAETHELRERLLAQLSYHQLRVYLHLPFMLQSAANERYVYSRNACLESSRKMLQIYHTLRGSGNGQVLYECKSVDFLGFTAATLILLGLLGYGRMSAHPDPIQEEADWRTIEITMDILQRASTEKGGTVAAQSYKVLQQLSYVRYNDVTPTDNCPYDSAVRFVIPYFGTISIRRGQKFNAKSITSASNSTVNSPPSVNSGNSPMTQPMMLPASNINHLLPPKKMSTAMPTSGSMNLTAESLIMYDGFYVPNALDQPLAGGDDGLSAFPNAFPNNNQWSLGAMDIDQDWNYFLNDPNSMGIGMGGGGMGGQNAASGGYSAPGMQGSFLT